ncbi:hypothetical protein BDFB_014308 [Asbolus verrucosus]|jgi:hypothetical protein
MGTQ